MFGLDVNNLALVIVFNFLNIFGFGCGLTVIKFPNSAKPLTLAVILIEPYNMRNEAEIKNLILDFAKQDDGIRAVLLNGSRANSNINPDQFQDFDIVFIVDKLGSFTTDHFWTDIFFKKIIFQLPDEMTFGDENNYQKNVSFTYIMLFQDKNRIDLTLFSKQKITSEFKLDSLTNLWLDKDKLFCKTSSTKR